MLFLSFLAVAAGVGEMSPAFPFWDLAPARPTHHVGMLVPLTRHSCGPSRYLAMRMAANDIANKNAALCPAIGEMKNDFQVSYDVFDSNGNGVGATSGAIKAIDAGGAGVASKPAKMIVGPNSSGSSKTSSSFLQVYGIPQISWASTNAQLSNKDNYPQFFRVVPPDSIAMQQLVRLILSLKYTTVTLMYFDADFQAGQASDFQTAADELGLAIEYVVQLPNSGAGGAVISDGNRPAVRAGLQRARSQSTWVVACFAITAEARGLLDMAYEEGMIREGWAWFGGDGFATIGGHDATPEGTKSIVGVHFIVAQTKSSRFSAFQDRWAAEIPTLDLPEFESLEICGPEQNKKCAGDAEFKGWSADHAVELKCTGYTALAYDAMVTSAVVFDRLLSSGLTEDAMTSADYLNGLRDLMDSDNAFECLTAGSIAFNENQERPLPFSVQVYEAGLTSPTEIGMINFMGEVSWCEDAGISCSRTSVSWPYDTATEAPGVHTSLPRGTPPVCAAGQNYDPKAGECIQCAVGEFWSAGNGLCMVCPAGSYCPVGVEQPVVCSPGRFCEGGTSAPTLCEKGWEQPEANRTSCSPCAAGHSAAQRGTSECTICNPGTFAPEIAASVCETCAVGTYASGAGSKQCETCARGSTRLLGATAPSDCQCEEGTFFVAATESCAPCQEGLYCPGDDKDPLVYPGFFAEWVEDRTAIAVFRCAFSELACPGGPVQKERLDGSFKHSGVPELRSMEVCAAGSGLLEVNGCTRCEDGSYFTKSTGKCVQCSGQGAYYPLFFIAMVVVVLVVYKVTANPKSQQVSAAMMLSCLGGITVTAAQTLGIYSQFTITFPAALEGFLAFLRLFLFDVEVLNVTCALGSTLGARWGARMIAPFVFLAVVCCIYFCSRALARVSGRDCGMDMNKLINAVGLMTNVVYITLCKLSMQLLECRTHPSAPSTVAVYPDIKCQDEARHTLLPFNIIIILLLPVGIYVLFCYLCYVAPKKWSSSFQERSKFLLRRWKPTLWWFGPVCMMRNLLLAVVSVVFPSSPLEQLSTMCCLLVIYAVVQSTMQPWRSDSINKTDAFLNSIIGLLCMFSMALAPPPLESEDRRGSFAPVVMLLMIVAFAALGLAVLRAVTFALRFEQEKERQNALAREAAKALEFVATRITSACGNEKAEGGFVEAIATAFTGGELTACMGVANLVLTEVFNERLVGPKARYSRRLTARIGSKEATQVSAEEGIRLHKADSDSDAVTQIDSDTVDV